MWESSTGAAGKDIHHKGMVWACMTVLSPSPPSSSIPSVGTQQGKKKLFPDQGPLQQPGSTGIWPQLPPLLQLKERAIWKLDMVCKWNPTCKQLRMWVMCDTQPHICTWFAQWIPVIFRGWNKTPVQQAPQLSESEIFSRVLQSGFPSDGNVSHSNSPAPLFQMLSLSQPQSHTAEDKPEATSRRGCNVSLRSNS